MTTPENSSPTWEDELSMLSRLILFFVKETKGFLSKIELVKFLYLADLYSVKWRNQQITDLRWLRYKHGPWEERIYREIDKLEQMGLLYKEQHNNTTMLKPSSTNDVALNLPLGLTLMLENIHRGWAGYSANDRKKLLEFVYETAPMKELDQQGVNPEIGTPLDLHAERKKLFQELDLETSKVF